MSRVPMATSGAPPPPRSTCRSEPLLASGAVATALCSQAVKAEPAAASGPRRPPVDREVPGRDGYHVYDEYHCKLNQTNIGGNNNKYYIIQVYGRGGRSTGPRMQAPLTQSMPRRTSGPLLPSPCHVAHAGPLLPSPCDVAHAGPCYPVHATSHMRGPSYPVHATSHVRGPSYPVHATSHIRAPLTQSMPRRTSGPLLPSPCHVAHAGPCYPVHATSHMRGPSYPVHATSHVRGPSYPVHATSHMRAPLTQSMPRHTSGPLLPSPCHVAHAGPSYPVHATSHMRAPLTQSMSRHTSGPLLPSRGLTMASHLRGLRRYGAVQTTGSVVRCARGPAGASIWPLCRPPDRCQTHAAPSALWPSLPSLPLPPPPSPPLPSPPSLPPFLRTRLSAPAVVPYLVPPGGPRTCPRVSLADPGEQRDVFPVDALGPCGGTGAEQARAVRVVDRSGDQGL